MTTTRDVADAFTALLREGKDHEAGERFWAPNVVSLEPMEGDMARLEGAEAIRQKHDWWTANFTVHAATYEGPFIHGDQFAIMIKADIEGPEGRAPMTEVALYTVKAGKVTEERFFALPQPG